MSQAMLPSAMFWRPLRQACNHLVVGARGFPRIDRPNDRRSNTQLGYLEMRNLR